MMPEICSSPNFPDIGRGWFALQHWNDAKPVAQVIGANRQNTVINKSKNEKTRLALRRLSRCRIRQPIPRV